MAIAYNWVVEQLEVTNEDNLQQVVIIAHYRYQGNEVVDGKNYFAEVYGTVNLAPPNPEDFTPYNELTKDQVEGWLAASLPVEAMQSNIATQIQNQVAPTVTTPPLPWQTAPSSNL